MEQKPDDKKKSFCHSFIGKSKNKKEDNNKPVSDSRDVKTAFENENTSDEELVVSDGIHYAARDYAGKYKYCHINISITFFIYR